MLARTTITDIALDHSFYRRSYTTSRHYELNLTAGEKTSVDSALSEIQFLFLRITGDATNVRIYKNNGAGWYSISDSFMAAELQDCQSLTLQADDDTTVEIYIGGSA